MDTTHGLWHREGDLLDAVRRRRLVAAWTTLARHAGVAYDPAAAPDGRR